ncbi:MAG TPA: hypothetical protein HPP79_13155, partial [Gammaproteobacteria bacterium]|nr:hypothetical protein [Gammaproteobacteria bacterium]
FLFECDHCQGLSATAMNNIPTSEWHQFIAESELQVMVSNYLKVSHKA